MQTFSNVTLYSETATKQDAFREWVLTIIGEILGPDGERPQDSEIRDHVLVRFREVRKQMLLDSDWAILPDSPLDATAKSRFVAWRQALRDLPQNYPDIRDAVLPDEPELT